MALEGSLDPDELAQLVFDSNVELVDSKLDPLALESQPLDAALDTARS